MNKGSPGSPKGHDPESHGRQRLWVLHPFLLAVFPVLFLYGRNAREVSIGEIAIPILASAVFTLLLWVLLNFLLRSTAKAGLATSLFVFMFFSYGHLYGLVEDWGAFIPKHAHLLPFTLLVFGYAVYLMRRYRFSLVSTTRVLNLVAAVLILFNLSIIAAGHIASQRSSPVNLDPIDAQAAPSDNLTPYGTLPDIYVIILDEYAHPATMAEYYQFDNSEFTESLSQMGFFIAENSRATAFWSREVIASLLNLEYMRGMTEHTCYQKIADNRVAELLRSFGYQYIYFGSWYEVGRWETNADTYCNLYNAARSIAPVSEFGRTLAHTTMLLPFYDYLAQEQYSSYYRRGIVDTLEQLGQIPELEGPKFVFAHIMCPHEPFVFGPNGEETLPIDRYNYEDKDIYLGQYIYITKEIEKTVTQLVEKSSTPPVIVLQSDHGLRAMELRGLDLPSDEYFRILNACYMPDDGSAGLYDSISPLNTLRVILNHHFNTGYPLLKD